MKKNPPVIGVSPKAIAALLTAYVATYAVAGAAKLLGLELDVGLVTALVGPLVLAGVTYAATWLAKVGLVEIKDEEGLALLGVLVTVLVAALVCLLLAALTGSAVVAIVGAVVVLVAGVPAVGARQW